MKKAPAPSIYRCPKCCAELRPGPQALVCAACAAQYPRIKGYYDLYVYDRALPATAYPPELEALHFSAEKILALPVPPPRRVLDWIFCRRHFNSVWTAELETLKQSIEKYGADEKNRVEFMIDDRQAAEFIEQKKISSAKAENIMKYVSRLPRGGNRVLHVGCGGECNEAIPRAYREAGFANFGVDAVRSYVEEFAAQGEAHLANAAALPYADGSFDVVNFTDILEHLFDPLAGLLEAARVLKKNGYLVLETPNRMYGQRLNPFSWLEYFLGLLNPGLLRPRLITTRWQGDVLFHSEFSKRELRALLGCCGLRPLKFHSEVLRFHAPENWRAKSRQAIVFCLEKIVPMNKWLVIARKA